MQIKSRKIPYLLPGLLAGAAFVAMLMTMGRTSARAEKLEGKVGTKMTNQDVGKIGEATFAGGCFWCMESPYLKVTGVLEVLPGYSGGHVDNPSYEDVSGGETGHAEVVNIKYDATKVSYSTLLEVYWRSIDPTDAGGQFADRGSQYRPVIFYHNAEQKRLAEESLEQLNKSHKFSKPAAVEITPFKAFFVAEEYHRNYGEKNPLRYHAYRTGSGRAGFIEKNWQIDLPKAPEIPVTSENDGIEDAAAPGSAKQAGSVSTASAGKEYSRPPDAELKQKLSPIQFGVTQQCGTEPPFHNEFWDNHREGIYVDIVSGEPLFSSKDKFNSGTGWPSFTRPLEAENIANAADKSLGMERMEVRSKHGNSHLGHLFDDGPRPTGMRYCINSASLRFIPKEKLVQEGYGKYAKLFADSNPH